MEQLLSFDLFHEIIVVDSSDQPILAEGGKPGVRVVYSEIKNQPFQRYLGFLSSSAEIIYFFDDDVRVLDSGELIQAIEDYRDGSVVGVGTEIYLNEKYPGESKDERRVNPIVLLFKKLKVGEYWLYGLKGVTPETKSEIQFLKGPGFSVRRDSLYKNFNFQLLSLYSLKLGKGEDALLTYTLSKQGKVLFNPKEPIIHGEELGSQYARTVISYNRRIAVSRLYHSLEYCRLNEKGIQFYLLAYALYYSLLGTTFFKSLIFGLLKLSRIHFFRAVGIVEGLLISLIYPFLIPSRKNAKKVWLERAERHFNEPK